MAGLGEFHQHDEKIIITRESRDLPEARDPQTPPSQINSIIEMAEKGHDWLTCDPAANFKGIFSGRRISET